MYQPLQISTLISILMLLVYKRTSTGVHVAMLAAGPEAAAHSLVAGCSYTGVDYSIDLTQQVRARACPRHDALAG